MSTHADSVPDWMKVKSKDATRAIWGAFRKQKPLRRNTKWPKKWLSYVYAPIPSGQRRRGGLFGTFGFDVEQCEGWAKKPAFGRQEVEPTAGKQYLRVTKVDDEASPHRLDCVDVGDVIMSFFGRDDDPAVSSKASFRRAARQLPFCYFVVYRASLEE